MFKKILSLVLLCVIITTSFSAVFAEENERLYDGKVPAVVGIQFKNEDMAATPLAKAKSAGFGYARKGIYWTNIEKSKGVYDWSQSDAWIKSMEDNGMTMLLTIAWNNRIYEDLWDRAIVTDEGREGFSKFVAELVKRYKGKKIIYEIWNEPNLRGFWHENDIKKSNTKEMAKEYTELVLACVPAMKKADPDCKVAVGSISCLWKDSFNWFEGCIEAGITGCGADYISVHPYGFTYPELSMRDGYPVIRRYLDNNGGKDIGIINSEVGFSETYLIEHGATEDNVEDVQAYCFVRQNIVDMIAGVELTTWYEFSDASWGVVGADFSERPTHTAAKVMTTELDGYKYLYRMTTDSTDDYVVVFVNDAGKKKIVAWTSPKSTMPSDKKIPETHSITIPVGLTGTHKITDVFGKTSTLTSVDNNLEITISGAPQYIDNVTPREPTLVELVGVPAVPEEAEASDNSISVVLNGHTLAFDVSPQIINDRTMVPIRAIFEALGATVTWDDETQTATAVRGDKTVKMSIGVSVIDVNGKRSFIDASPVLIDGRTLAPARFVAEAFGAEVEWDEYTNTVRISVME